MSTVAAFIDARVASVKKISLRDFLTQYHQAFEQDLDLSFMDYFLELSKRENKGQFIVHHEKLIEYGIATLSSGSTDIPRRLKALGMTKDQDTLLRNFAEQSETSRGVKHKKVYFLTPKAFKLCLIRAQKYKSQKIDVSRYANYYLFLEEVVGYYQEYQLRLEKLMSVGKDDRIASLELAMHEMDVRAERQRAEILGETKTARDNAKRAETEATAAKTEATAAKTEATAAKEEVKKAREDISDLHETVIDHHAAAMNAVQHASVKVAPSKRRYFALTSYQLIGDTSGTLYFTAWRRQANTIGSLLVSAMTKSIEGKNEEKYTPHHLVIPPIYFPGAVDLGNAGKSNLDTFIKNKLAELNRGRKRGEKIKISDFKESIGLTSSSVHPVWTPNEHMSHCEFVDCFLDVLKEAKAIKLAVAEPSLQKKIDKQLRLQHQTLINATGEARERLAKTVEMIERARDEMATPPGSDGEDVTDGDISE